MNDWDDLEDNKIPEFVSQGGVIKQKAFLSCKWRIKSQLKRGAARGQIEQPEGESRDKWTTDADFTDTNRVWAPNPDRVQRLFPNSRLQYSAHHTPWGRILFGSSEKKEEKKISATEESGQILSPCTQKESQISPLDY